VLLLAWMLGLAAAGTWAAADTMILLHIDLQTGRSAMVGLHATCTASAAIGGGQHYPTSAPPRSPRMPPYTWSNMLEDLWQKPP